MAPDGTKTLREDQGDRKDPVAQEGKGKKVRGFREGPGSPPSVTILGGWSPGVFGKWVVEKHLWASWLVGAQ